MAILRSRFAILSVSLLFCTSAYSDDLKPVEELDQGWTIKQRVDWYTGSQGSRLIPLAWLRALEQEKSTLPFLDPNNIASFGYLPRGDTASAALPVGFAVDRSDDTNLVRTHLRWKRAQGNNEPWVGLTCAACHTADISYRGTKLRIDGGSANADFQAFMDGLNGALIATKADPQKWKRFAAAVLNGGSNDPAQASMLASAFDILLEWQKREAAIDQTTSHYGPGRVDAFGRIYNKVALVLNPTDAKGNAPDAPVSIPFIWRAPQLDKVQYNGIAQKILFAGTFDYGALGRNVGEMIGVFGDVRAAQNPGLSNGFTSSVNVHNLVALEDQLSTLRPPKWPYKFFGEVVDDQRKQRTTRGAQLYQRRCVSCHATFDRNDLSTVITAQMNLFSPPGTSAKLETDPWMACNAYDYSVSSGILTGFDNSLLTPAPLPPEHKVGDLLRITVASTLLGQKLQLTKEVAAKLIGLPRKIEAQPYVAVPGTEKEQRLRRCLTRKDPNLGYTSRPLNGVWASPPFLHNGSVPTVYDLLLPSAQRPSQFAVGSGEYDPVKMGLAASSIKKARHDDIFKTTDSAGQPIPGNSNIGHDYSNATLSDDDRYAIIEYLKTL